MGTPEGKKQISVYLQPDIKDELARLAKVRKRSVNSLVEILIEQELQQAKKGGEFQ
ncbi:MAG: hypothetical protein CLLPBCKN_003356 [Chroococcidiopsis cubana SAG 39.79]|uniref:Ribbon-helix-helix protein CopG domain-containing protein n=1 Tax=Chroococcidiopsis cubana SAG 39.79 TaxID=388085 RepID=A0AB37U8L5_9CYAN|nr:ribbon-helix-helix protein, CopG family [Chroococcidiopsis cubana]MDZ4873960.1 hypothetical protein [Chroococcidiopsis cubana SAG 39.79]PSB59678.1 hypothetical protein C7B79_28610 [Chroococcidiopsis cubana CCALA 043]RUT00479.1 hypothetical protein DSM107010_67870 [Chroococcidiopsis cubana SAG 39.79]